MITNRLGRILIASVASVCAAIAIIILADVWSREGDEVTVITDTSIGGPFTLVGPTGATVTDKSWPGKYLLISFGYTFCPDVCPTELATIGNALDAMGEEADRIQPLFISFDTERDTPAVMAGYAPMFHPRLIGLTGTPEQIAAVTSEFRVIYRKREAQGASPYLMEHSSLIYLVAPDGKTAAILPPEMDAETMARQVEMVIEQV